MVEKDVEIARLTEALLRVEGDLSANKKKLFAKDDQLEELREELQDKEEGLAFLRARLDTRAELEAPLKQDPEALQAEEDRLLQRSPSRLTSLSHASQQEEDEADDADEPEEEEESSSEPATEDAASEHKDNICHLVRAPLRRGKRGTAERARRFAEQAIDAFGEGAVGIFGVEMFLMPNGEFGLPLSVGAP